MEIMSKFIELDLKLKNNKKSWIDYSKKIAESFKKYQEKSNIFFIEEFDNSIRMGINIGSLIYTINYNFLIKENNVEIYICYGYTTKIYNHLNYSINNISEVNLEFTNVLLLNKIYDILNKVLN